MNASNSEYSFPLFLIAIIAFMIFIKAFDTRFKTNRHHDAFLLILCGASLLLINSIGNRFLYRDYFSYLLIFIGVVLLIINIPVIRSRMPEKISKNIFQDTDKATDKTEKTFVSAERSSPYYIETWLFLVLPVGLLYLLIRTWLKGDSLDKTFVSIMVGLLFVFVAGMFIFFRKYRVIKIETDENGLLFIGLLKRVFVRWDEIQSVGALTSFFGKNFAKLRTTNTTLYFPLSMKENKIYPKLKIGISESKWIEESGIEKPYNLYNCPLYKEIRSRTDKI